MNKAPDSMQKTREGGLNSPLLAVGNIDAPTFLWPALDAVTQASNIKHAVLHIHSLTVRGRIGIFCNRYLVGAVIDGQDKTGMAGLSELLAVRSGVFGFRECNAREVSKLKQGLVVDIVELLGDRSDEGDQFATPAGALTDRSLVSKLTESVEIFSTEMDGQSFELELTLNAVSSSMLGQSHLAAADPQAQAQGNIARDNCSSRAHADMPCLDWLFGGTHHECHHAHNSDMSPSSSSDK